MTAAHRDGFKCHSCGERPMRLAQVPKHTGVRKDGPSGDVNSLRATDGRQDRSRTAATAGTLPCRSFDIVQFHKLTLALTSAVPDDLAIFAVIILANPLTSIRVFVRLESAKF